jgi:hypothetical protein
MDSSGVHLIARAAGRCTISATGCDCDCDPVRRTSNASSRLPAPTRRHSRRARVAHPAHQPTHHGDRRPGSQRGSVVVSALTRAISSEIAAALYARV